VLTVFSSPIIGKLSDKYGRLIVFGILTLLALIPLIAIPNLYTHSKWILLVVCSTLFIFSGSRMIIASAQITGSVNMQERGSFLIINSSIQQLSTGIIAAIGGAIITNDSSKALQHYPMLGIIGVVLAIVSFVLFKYISSKATMSNQ
jgi:MFS transporter, DHA1 family, inner membrane transport protein